MSIIDIYLMRQVAGPSVLAVVAISVLGIASEIQERLKALPLAQVTFGDISRLGLLVLPTLVTFVVPITYMLGVLLAFGRLSQNNEITAMKAAGISLKRVVAPVVVFGALLSGVCFLIQDQFQPWAVRKMNELIYSEIPLRLTMDALPTGVMQDYSGWRVYVGSRDAKTRDLKKIIILKPEDSGRTSTYYAESARLYTENGETVLELKNGHFILPSENDRAGRFTFDTTRLIVPPIAATMRPSSKREMPVAKLLGMESDLKVKAVEADAEGARTELMRLRWEIGQRIAMPFACLTVTLAAAALGARSRRSGKSYSFSVGFLIILVYYVLQMGLVPESLLSMSTTMLLAWAPNLVVGLAGVFFLWRVDHV